MDTPGLRVRPDRFLLAALVALLALVGPLPCSAQDSPRENPRLSLPRSGLGLDPDSPVYLLGRVGAGGAFSNSNGQFGYGGAIVFHPDQAANFLEFLAQWNAGLVLQADYQELYTHYRIRSGDVVVRRYLGAVDSENAGRVFFLDAGIGMSEISFAEGEERGTQIGWAPLVGLGFEWPFGGKYLCELRGQYRQYKRQGHDYINWSARLGLGMPLPW